MASSVTFEVFCAEALLNPGKESIVTLFVLDFVVGSEISRATCTCDWSVVVNILATSLTEKDKLFYTYNIGYHRSIVILILIYHNILVNLVKYNTGARLSCDV